MDWGITAFLYNVFKDLMNWWKKRSSYVEKEKYVDRTWLEKSPLKKKWEEEGYRLFWSNVDQMESTKLEEWEVMYESDLEKKVKYKFVIKNAPDQVLMGKKKAKGIEK